MKFVKQWSSVQRPYTSTVSKSMTIPNQVLPLQKIIARIQSGNMFGVSMQNISYDSDDPNFNEDTPHVRLDPADPINSMAELRDDLDYLKKKAKDARKASDQAKNENTTATVV